MSSWFCCCCKNYSKAENLTDQKRVLIVGGGNGMGLATVKILLQSTNDIVIAADIHIDNLSKLLIDDKTGKYRNRLYFHKMDVTSVESCEQFIAWFTSDSLKNTKNLEVNNHKNTPVRYTSNSKIDRILICVGIWNSGPLLEISEKDFVSTFNVNFIGVWRVIRLLHKYKLLQYGLPNKNDNSRIIIISSESAYLNVIPFNEPYVMSKIALQNLARTLKMELSVIGIDVITINPGAVNTQLLKKASGSFAHCNLLKKALEEDEKEMVVDGETNESIFSHTLQLFRNSRKSFESYLFVVEPETVVNEAILPAIHNCRSNIKWEYSVNLTWFIVILHYIPHVVYDEMMMCLFHWNKYYRDEARAKKQ